MNHQVINTFMDGVISERHCMTTTRLKEILIATLEKFFINCSYPIPQVDKIGIDQWSYSRYHRKSKQPEMLR